MMKLFRFQFWNVNIRVAVSCDVVGLSSYMLEVSMMVEIW